jgi:hypothetical protein
MTVLALRYPLSDRRSRAPELTRRRFGHNVRDDRSSTVAQPVPTDIQVLKARIESGAYVVDAEKVATAIVERLLDGRTLRA